MHRRLLRLTRSRPAVARKLSPTHRLARTPTVDQRQRTAQANRRSSVTDRVPQTLTHTRRAVPLRDLMDTDRRARPRVTPQPRPTPGTC